MRRTKNLCGNGKRNASKKQKERGFKYHHRFENIVKIQNVLRQEFDKQIKARRKTFKRIYGKEKSLIYRKAIEMVETALKKQLKEIQLKAVLKSGVIKPLLNECVAEIHEQASKAKNEATIESSFEISFYGLLKELGLKIFPEKQKAVNTKRHVNKGKIDSSYGAVVIEYKHKSKLKTVKHLQYATKQIVEYIEGLATDSDDYYLGVITDGLRIKFISYRNIIIHEGKIHKLNDKDILWLIKNIISLETKELNSKNLVAEFCFPERDNLSIKLIRALHKALVDNPTKKTHMLNAEWERLFKLGHEDKSHQQKIEERGVVLGEIVNKKNLDLPEQYNVLFCLQTAYAIIVKLIAYRVISDIYFDSPLDSFKSLSSSDKETLRIFFENYEEGSIFRDLGIDNLLEGDFFSWYCTDEQWNDDIGDILQEIILKLSDYEDKKDIFHKSKVYDLFRELYLNIIPGVVRYSLGEYYTPRWLAQHLLEVAVNGKDLWRGLDPCAGSGTFVIAMIERIIDDCGSMPKEQIFNQVIKRVKAIDLNPLSVLTARVNYFVAISAYIPDSFTYIEIPVYLGDSANIPKESEVDGIKCITYQISTELGDLEIVIPKSALKSAQPFSEAMYEMEGCIRNNEPKDALSSLLKVIPEAERTDVIKSRLKHLTDILIELEKQKWNRIWSRIIKNFLSTASLGKFDVIIGNPPWIDWKNLPTGYRNQIKGLCLRRNLFSGDGLTGGINLNICALITNVVAENWLSDSGVFGFLMPKPLIFQQTYDGFRKLKLEHRSQLYFKELHDWTNAGHPFYPVTQHFLTYYFSFKKPPFNRIPVKKFFKMGIVNIPEKHLSDWSEVKGFFNIESCYAGQLSKDHTAYTYTNKAKDLTSFRKVSGKCAYKGREGIEFYPQEITLFTIDEKRKKRRKNILWLNNLQNPKSKYKVPNFSVLLEQTYLYPLVKGPDIKQFEIDHSGFIVPFPYEKENPRLALEPKDLRKKSPLLLQHFQKFRKIIEMQTDYNRKIKGKYDNIFYSFARVGKYSFAPVHVVYRDNTKWGAAVVTETVTPWGENKRFLFQNHAVSMCEDEDGNFITEDEAHYICAILNAPIVVKFILQSSDSRTFKINPPIFLPKFNKKDKKHLALSRLSKQAHFDPVKKEGIRQPINKIYLKICEKNPDL